MYQFGRIIRDFQTLSKAQSAFGSELALFAFCEWRLELSYLLVGIVVYGGMQLGPTLSVRPSVIDLQVAILVRLT